MANRIPHHSYMVFGNSIIICYCIYYTHINDTRIFQLVTYGTHFLYITLLDALQGNFIIRSTDPVSRRQTEKKERKKKEKKINFIIESFIQ